MYLDCMANQDAEFKTLYNNNNKNLDECILYIQGKMYEKAKELAKEGKKQSVCLAPTDDEVFALAVRYWYDTDIKIEGNSFDNVKILSMAATSFTEEEKAKMRQDAIRKYQDNVIAEQKKKADELKQKKQKAKTPNAPTLVPNVPAEKKEQKGEKKENKRT